MPVLCSGLGVSTCAVRCRHRQDLQLLDERQVHIDLTEHYNNTECCNIDGVQVLAGLEMSLRATEDEREKTLTITGLNQATTYRLMLVAQFPDSESEDLKVSNKILPRNELRTTPRCIPPSFQRDPIPGWPTCSDNVPAKDGSWNITANLEVQFTEDSTSLAAMAVSLRQEITCPMCWNGTLTNKDVWQITQQAIGVENATGEPNEVVWLFSSNMQRVFWGSSIIHHVI